MSRPPQGFETELVLLQPGGQVDNLLVVADGDPLMTAGERYLLMLAGPYPPDAKSKTAFFGGLPFGRFRIEDDILVPTDGGWSEMLVSRRFAGLATDAAIAELKSLLDTAGIPTAQ